MSTLSEVLARIARPEGDGGGRPEPTYLDATWLGLSGAERRQAEDAVIARLEADGDPRAARTAALLHLERAVPALRRWADPTSPTRAEVREQAALALGTLTSELAALDQALASPIPMTRHGAAKKVAGIGTAEAWARLRALCFDPHPLVRNAASGGLVAAFGLRALALDAAGAPLFQSPIERLQLAIASDVEPLWRVGAEELLAALGQVAAGASPGQAGLVYSPSPDPAFVPRFLASVEDRAAAIDLGAAASMGGCDRAWAETFLAVRLERGFRDARVPAALRTLLGERAEPLLAWAATRLPEGHPVRDEALRVTSTPHP